MMVGLVVAAAAVTVMHERVGRTMFQTIVSPFSHCDKTLLRSPTLVAESIILVCNLRDLSSQSPHSVASSTWWQGYLITTQQQESGREGRIDGMKAGLSPSVPFESTPLVP